MPVAPRNCSFTTFAPEIDLAAEFRYLIFLLARACAPAVAYRLYLCADGRHSHRAHHALHAAHPHVLHALHDHDLHA
ncbi:hypothetical protein D3C85_1644080 [compost metagenome]